MEKTLQFLETYKGRDRILRLLSYSSKCAAGLIKTPEIASCFDNFSRQLSTSRACFRLVDDLPTLKDAFDNFKLKEKTSPARLLSLFENVLDIFFNILDHMSWAIDHRIIMSNSTFWDKASTFCWVISLYINLFKISVKLSNTSKEKLKLQESSPTRDQKKELSALQWKLQLSFLKCLADLLFAVNYLPKGTLWATFFNKWQVGALGSFSSIISLYLALFL